MTDDRDRADASDFDPVLCPLRPSPRSGVRIRGCVTHDAELLGTLGVGCLPRIWYRCTRCGALFADPTPDAVDGRTP